ncbi:alpha/beta hydrolase [Actinocrispum wychmicini]|nr:alpha/beta hydrolase [Actinocrispum wychmicini]
MRKTLQLLTIAAVAVGVSAPVAAASSRPEWATCATAVQQECAKIEVPLDYDRPAGPRISLAISRIRTATPQLRRGVLLLIPGGPGNTGLQRPTALGLHLPKDVLDRYDLIGFDPRGTGESTPVNCALTPQDITSDQFLPWPDANGDITANAAHARRVAEACAGNGGPLMQHISTPTEARDIDQIRIALGERKLSSWGTSYGTYAGAVYATMFPGHTDRVVLDSNDDPDPKRLERGWLNNFAVGGEDRFPDFAAFAAARDSTYGLGTTPAAVRETYLSLAASLDRAPRPDLTGNGFRSTMFNGLYNTSNFPLLAQVLQGVRTGGPVPAIPVPPNLQNLVAVSTATACNDVAWPRSVQFYADAVARSRSDFPLTAGMPANIMPCAFWPFQPVQPVRITPYGPDNVLLVQNLRDPATPYSGALKMRAAFGHRARMVTVNSGGHGAYLVNGNPCGDNAVTAFLVNGTYQDTTC